LILFSSVGIPCGLSVTGGIPKAGFSSEPTSDSSGGIPKEGFPSEPILGPSTLGGLLEATEDDTALEEELLLDGFTELEDEGWLEDGGVVCSDCEDGAVLLGASLLVSFLPAQAVSVSRTSTMTNVSILVVIAFNYYPSFLDNQAYRLETFIITSDYKKKWFRMNANQYIINPAGFP
jgi:hypothetical protein